MFGSDSVELASNGLSIFLPVLDCYWFWSLACMYAQSRRGDSLDDVTCLCNVFGRAVDDHEELICLERYLVFHNAGLGDLHALWSCTQFAYPSKNRQSTHVYPRYFEAP
jgi:hypothetical protein